MKRIAMFIPASLRSSPAGTYTPVLTDLVERLSTQYAITVFTLVPPTGETESYSCGEAEVQVVPVRYNAPLLHRTTRFLHAFIRTHRKRPYDLVHGFWATSGGLAAVGSGMIHGLPSIVTLQGGEAASLPLLGYGNMYRFSTRTVTLWTCRQASAVTALTRFQADAIMSFGLKREIQIIPYGAPGAFSCPPARKPHDSPVRFLHVADVNVVKDQETLLRAFRTISRQVDARLTIAGRDLLDGRIARLASEMGISDKVRFLGYVHHEKLPALYASADFLLHTSLYEAQGVVISEACAAGAVVCGTRVGLVADLEGTCAVAVPPGDPEALARAVIALVESPERYKVLQAAAKIWADKHTAAWTAAQFAKLYDALSNF